MLAHLRVYDHYLLAAMAFIGTFAASAGLVWLSHRSRLAPQIRTFRGLSPPFVGVVGVLFALTLAFLANDTWSAHDRALNATFHEAGALRNILALSSGVAHPTKGRVQAAVHDYARLVVDEEWPLLARREDSRAASAALDALFEVLSGNLGAAGLNANAQTLILEEAVDIRADRDLRVALSRTHVNPLKWLGMAFLGFITMISVAMVYIDQPRAEILAIMLFSAAAAPTAAIVLVQGNPFQQPTGISPTPIAALVGTQN